MASSITPEGQNALNQLGVTLDQFLFYEARRIDGRYLTQAMAALLFYDFFLTFGEEVDYVWKTKPRISVAKVLWFLNRYWPLVSVFVRIWGMAYMFPTKLFNIAIVDILLMLRVWALYNGSKRVMWILIGIFLVGMPAAIAIRKVPPIPSLPLVIPASQSLTICKRSPPSELFSLYTMELAIDTVIFGMLVFKAWGKDMRGQMPVLATLVRDGAMYYLAITLVLAFMIAATTIPTLYQPVADANINIPLCSLACNRLILSLRGVYFKKRATGDGTITTNVETARPHFASHTTRDIPLDSIQVFSPRSTMPFKSFQDDEFDWDEPRSPSSHNHHLGSKRHSAGITFTDSYGTKEPRASPAPRLAESPGPVIARVTVTTTKSVVADDGRVYEVPVEHRSRGQERAGNKGADWWESDESLGKVQQGDVKDGHAVKPRVYETRVGYHNNRIDEEEEEWFDDGRAGKAV